MPFHGGDSEGSGCGVCLGTACSLMFLSDVEVLDGAGALYLGLFTILGGVGPGGSGLTMVLSDENGVADGVVILTLVFSVPPPGLPINKKASMMLIEKTVRQTIKITASRVKRKYVLSPFRSM